MHVNTYIEFSRFYTPHIVLYTTWCENHRELRLIEFIAKHTPDRFFLIEDQSVSVRTKIAREIIANSLTHREYTSAYPAKIIIERDRIITENWNLPKRHGRIDPDHFTPYPKNPIIANFFVNIGRADALGSGIRNLYRYTRIYSGSQPVLIEDDVFRTVIPLKIPLSPVSGIQEMSDNTVDNSSSKTIPRVFERREMILVYIARHGEISASSVSKIIRRSPVTARRILGEMVREGILVASGANRNRKYRLP